MISFIAPFYNTDASMFEGFVQSLKNQTCSDWELLLMNDGSSDTSALSFLDTLPSEKVRLFNLTHGGVSKSRNAGLQAAQGELIWFVDSDDMIASDAVEVIINEFLAHPDTELLVVGYYVQTHSGIKSVSSKLLGQFDPFEGFSSLCKLGDVVNGYPWTKVLNVSAIGKENIPLFNSHYTRYEDKLWAYQLLDIVEICRAIAHPCYTYMINPKGLSRASANLRELQESSYYAYQEILHLVEDKVGKSDLYYEALSFYFVVGFNDLARWAFVPRSSDPGRTEHKRRLLAIKEELDKHHIENKRYAWRKWLLKPLMLIT